MDGHWLRFFYQPCMPLGKDGRKISGSPEQIALSRAAAGEGMVLLKNNGAVLPLQKGSRVVLLGKASQEYVKGGGGSGDVNTAYTRSLYDGMKVKEQEGKVEIYEGLHDFYAQYLEKQFSEGWQKGMTVEPSLPEELLVQAARFSDIAILTICRFSGEGWDRKCTGGKAGNPGREFQEGENAMREMGDKIFQRGDFYLSDQEEALVRQAKAHFSHLIVLLNVGGVVDSEWFVNDCAIPAVLLMWQGGMEGGLAAADILCGDVTPSGHLADTFAKRLEDYPSTEGFHASGDYVEYLEDIYVGYRYFETIPGADARVNYPFGYGLSYTDFSIEVLETVIDKERVSCKISVSNTGNYPGKEVVQLYYGAPRGRLGKPAKELGGFAKTGLLLPGGTQELKISFAISDMASYDDLGKVCKAAYVLEKGEYRFFLGRNVRDAAELPEKYVLAKDVVVQQLAPRLTPGKLPERMLSDGSFEKLEQHEYEEPVRPPVFQTPQVLEGISPEVRAEKRQTLEERLWPVKKQFADVAEGKLSLEDFLADLSTEEMAWLLGGQPNTGVANTFGIGNNRDHGIPNVMTADGPAGLRILPACKVYTTAWPCATMLACTWNCELAEQVGAAGAVEVRENNIGIWLTPAMNIHRSPLCGRNFEYFSEDPLIAGKMGAALVRGIQSQKIAAVLKHFALNNKETNRKYSDSRVSERAAREIYLKGFEIAVKESHPMLVMASYNKINGIYSTENRELLTDILRDEWHFDGIVITDWYTRAEHFREVKAGCDVKMAIGYPEELLKALEDGRLEEREIRLCARRVLEMILKLY